MSDAFPLKWPPQRQRRPAGLRKNGKFTTARGERGYMEPITVAEAMARMQDELDRIGARYPVVSTNLEPRLDGRPRSGQPEPADPGVALYFDLNGKPHCLPCDTYTKVAQNIAAIAAHMERTRAIERYGVASVAEMFAGFLALPAPGQAHSQRWWNVLQIKVTEGVPLKSIGEDAIQAAYRRRAAELHPDRPGGSAAAMAELNVARDEALKAVRA